VLDGLVYVVNAFVAVFIFPVLVAVTGILMFGYGLFNLLH
jgi:hypothetical protein